MGGTDKLIVSSDKVMVAARKQRSLLLHVGIDHMR